MPQIKPALAVLSLATLLALCGCGDSNSKAVFGDNHPAGWRATHSSSAKTDIETCFSCHGDNLAGGISKVSCTQCHTAGPTSKHPVNWSDYAYARHAASYRAEIAANPAAATSCANTSCHGSSLSAPPGSTGPSCATACHLGGVASKHPAVWTAYSSHSNYVRDRQYDSSSCSSAACHGITAKGVFLSGPSCFSCHPADPTVLSPVPDKHPHNRLVNGSFRTTHKAYINTPGNGVATCYTSICHGTNGMGGAAATGPKCFGNGIAGCH